MRTPPLLISRSATRRTALFCNGTLAFIDKRRLNVLHLATIVAVASISGTGAAQQLTEINTENVGSLSGIVSANATNAPAESMMLTINGSGLIGGNSTTIAAGYTASGNATGNKLQVNGSYAYKFLHAGYSQSGSVDKNQVVIQNNRSEDDKATEFGNIYGGYSKASGNATGNSIVVKAGSVAEASGRMLCGGYANGSDAKVEGNFVVVETGASVGFYIRSGDGSSISEANGNYVRIEKDASVEGRIYGAKTSRNASDNYVEIRGTVTGDVSAVVGSSLKPSENPTINNTRVTLDGANVVGSVYAIDTRTAISATGTRVSLTNSTVTGFVSLAQTASVTGDYEFTGVNTVGYIQNDGNSTFTFHIGEENADAAVLSLTSEGYGLDLTTDTVVINGLESTEPNGTYKLIDTIGSTISIGQGTTLQKTGTFIDRLWEIEFDGETSEGGESTTLTLTEGIQITKGDLTSGDLVLAYGEERANNNSKTLAESFLGSVAFINQGAEFIADEGMRAMVDAAEVGKVSVFGAIHGGTSRYETGSHVDVDGVTLATGAVTKVGSLMLAGFVEAGWASSESHVSGTKGDGDHDYYGFGAALRYSFENQFYIDGSARFGWASTEFDGRYADASAKYDADSFYGSMHIGAGYVFGLTEKTDLDVYGRYVLTYLEGDTTGLDTPDGETFDMDDTMTHAFRVGARLTGEINESAGWRFGLAYEHVADGDAESDVIASGTRASLDVPTLEGDTGIVEAGITVRPNGTSPWSANIGIKGYVGDREGVSGNASIVYSF